MEDQDGCAKGCGILIGAVIGIAINVGVIWFIVHLVMSYTAK